MNDLHIASALDRLHEDDRDPGAWEELYRSIYPYLLALLYRGTRGNLHLAEEAVQEVMFRLLRSFNFKRSEVTPATLVAYAKQTTTSVMIDIFRCHARQQASTDAPESQGEQADPSQTDQAFFNVRLQEMLGKLSERDAHILDLLLQGRSTQEISDALNLGKKTAYNCVSLARRHLRAMLLER